MTIRRRYPWIRVAKAAAVATSIAVVASCASTSSLLENTLARNLAERDEAYARYLDESEIKVVLVGTAGPMSPELAQNATAVFVNGKFFLFDAGDYAQKRMEQFNLPVPFLDAIFITHFHNDHIADVGEVMQRSWMTGREKELMIHGPTGTERMVNGFIDVYGLDSNHRTDHHGEEYMPSEFHFATPVEFDANLNEVVVYEADGVVVTAFAASHPPVEPSFGYAIEYAGKKVVISGDTLITEELRRNSQGADLVVMDTMNYALVEAMENAFRNLGDDRMATIFYDIREYHPDVTEIGIFATKHEVARLALTHYAPSVPEGAMMRRVYINPIKAEYDGELIAGSDGTTVVIPLE